VDTEIPNRLFPAVRAVLWGVAVFVGLLLAAERFFEGHYGQALTSFCIGAASFVIAVYWERLIPTRWQERPQQLEYLSNRDTDLSSAIISAGWHSAYGRWFAAQILVNSGHPIQPRYLLHTVASQVMDKVLDGDIEVRGRKPGQMEAYTENVLAIHGILRCRASNDLVESDFMSKRNRTDCPQRNNC
jgi:hypothetical protein